MFPRNDWIYFENEKKHRAWKHEKTLGDAKDMALIYVG